LPIPVWGRREGLRFNLSIPEDIGMINADPDKITTLLYILLDNAAEYAPPASLGHRGATI
jgi:signal transduction histidine kinase